MPERPPLPERTCIFAVANQKGGVGKTTTVMNLAAELVGLGARVLVLDVDPQGSASTGLGIGRDRRGKSIHDVLSGNCALQDAAVESSFPGLHIVPATMQLSSADLEMASSRHRLHFLHEALTRSQHWVSEFHFVFLDCPPSLNLLTLNAIVAAGDVVVPLQAEFYALEGLSQLMRTVNKLQPVRRSIRIKGVLLTMFDGRNRLARQVEGDARNHPQIGRIVYETVIPRNVRLAEAPSHGLPMIAYDRKSMGRLAYRALALEVLGVPQQVKGKKLNNGQ